MGLSRPSYKKILASPLVILYFEHITVNIKHFGSKLSRLYKLSRKENSTKERMEKRKKIVVLYFEGTELGRY